MGDSAKSFRARLASLLLCCLLFSVVFGAALSQPSAALAQEESKKEADSAEEEKAKPDLFLHIINSVGIVFGIIFLIVSVLLVTLIVLLSMDVRMGVAVPTAFVEDFTDTVNKRQFKQAFDMCRTDNSYLARVLTAGMTRLQYGIEDAREAAYNMVESIKAGKEQLIAYMATIGTLGPLLGLVGTVWGMILNFMVLATEKTPKPEQLADGISHALVVTLIGIGLAVPAIFCHTLFRNRLIRVAMDTGNMADDLLTQMYHNSKKPAADTRPPMQAAPTMVPTAAAAVPAGRVDPRAIRPE
jgi:biopolymer transport protein ExbB